MYEALRDAKLNKHTNKTITVATMQASPCFPSDNLFSMICFYTHAIILERKVVTEIGKIALQSISGFTNWFNVKINLTGTNYLNFSSFCLL